MYKTDIKNEGNGLKTTIFLLLQSVTAIRGAISLVLLLQNKQFLGHQYNFRRQYIELQLYLSPELFLLSHSIIELLNYHIFWSIIGVYQICNDLYSIVIVLSPFSFFSLFLRKTEKNRKKYYYIQIIKESIICRSGEIQIIFFQWECTV